MCVMCIQYRIIDFNYYHYQPGTNHIIVYSKHVKHARTYAHTHTRTHACTHARTHERTHAHTHTHTRTHEYAYPPTHRRHRPGCRCSIGRCEPIHDEVKAPLFAFSLAVNGRSVLHSNKQSCVRRDIRDSFWCFSRIIKLLGPTETRTCDSMCVQTIRTV